MRFPEQITTCGDTKHGRQVLCGVWRDSGQGKFICSFSKSRHQGGRSNLLTSLSTSINCNRPPSDTFVVHPSPVLTNCEDCIVTGKAFLVSRTFGSEPYHRIHTKRMHNVNMALPTSLFGCGWTARNLIRIRTAAGWCSRLELLPRCTQLSTVR